MAYYIHKVHPFLLLLPMNQLTYLKVPFVWNEPKPLIDVSHRLVFEPVKTKPNYSFISVVASVMAASVDASDRKNVSEYGAYRAAERFLSESSDCYFYQDDWWQFGITETREIVGLVLPVIFTGCAKGGLEEGTIDYMGVVPEYRGLGFAPELLARGTRTLQEIGVWRIFCDTAVNNVRMISTFKRVGYRQYSEPYKRPV